MLLGQNRLEGDDSLHEFERLDRRSVKLDRIAWWILSGVLGLVLLAIWLMVGLVFRGSFDSVQWGGLICIVGIFAGMLWCSKVFPERTFAATSWQLKPNGLEIRRGIWWRHRIFIPTNRIQHTDVQQGPIERRFELATLVINTGGTHEPSIPLYGISLAKAEALRDKLSRKDHTPQFADSTALKVVS